MDFISVSFFNFNVKSHDGVQYETHHSRVKWDTSDGYYTHTKICLSWGQLRSHCGNDPASL